MSVLAECPECHKKQSKKNTICNKCSYNLSKGKKAKKIRYWIEFRIDNRKIRQFVGYSANEANAADGKRKGQKYENRIFEMIPVSDITFEELTKWYLGLNRVKKLAMFEIKKIHLSKFNAEFGGIKVNLLKLSTLEGFQADLLDEGFSRSYIDQIIGSVRTIVKKAFDDDMISGDCLKPFNKVKNLLKRNANARDEIFTHEQYEVLMKHLPLHLKPVIATAFWTGMRKDEILELTWNKVFIRERAIKLDIIDTKDEEKRVIPLPPPLYEILRKIPRAIHDNHVFLYKGKPIHDIREGLKKGMKAADIPYGRKTKGGLIFHDFRHTYNTNMRKAGVPEKLIMKITGHSTREMFDRYNTITQDEATRAVSQLMNLLQDGQKKETK
jgi:integrase